MALRSDAARLARTRLLIAFCGVYLLSMGFMALGDRFYAGNPHLIYTRLATVPFFLLLIVRLLRRVRVQAPVELWEARQLVAAGKPEAAHARFARLAEEKPGPEAARLLRSRRMLYDGLAISAAQEARLEMGRCSLLLGETVRAVRELEPLAAELPARADIAIELAEALARNGEEQRAGDLLRAALPRMDAMDRRGLRDQPSLCRLLGDAPLFAGGGGPLAPKLLRERLLLGALVTGAIAHALHLYLGLF